MNGHMGVIYQEHAILGASFSPNAETGVLGVTAYPHEPGPAGTEDGALLFDLTGSTYVLVSGACAAQMAQAVLAGRRLQVGQCAHEAVLTGDGVTTSVPLALRTGDTEHVLLDPSSRGQVLSAWLGFVAGIEQDGQRPYEGVSVEDASSMLVPFLLVGAAARSVLLDYVKRPSDLPRPGQVASVMLDAIGCVVASVPGRPLNSDTYLVLVPPRAARTLWRSLLSFSEVSPAGLDTLRGVMERDLPWARELDSSDALRLGRATLEGWDLVRPDDDFVGARRLGDR